MTLVATFFRRSATRVSILLSRCGGGVVGSFRLACRRWYSSCSPWLPSLAARPRPTR